jgi:hypothetical protein
MFPDSLSKQSLDFNNFLFGMTSGYLSSHPPTPDRGSVQRTSPTQSTQSIKATHCTTTNSKTRAHSKRLFSFF